MRKQKRDNQEEKIIKKFKAFFSGLIKLLVLVFIYNK